EGLPAVVTIALAIGVQRMARRNVLVRRLPAVETLGSVTVICSDKTGTLTRGVMVLRELQGPDSLRLLDAAAACCDAELQSGGEHGLGDPTELAILVEARARGIERAQIERERPRVNVAPFDPVRKRMSIERADGTLYVKGAAESVLPLCVTRDPELEEQAAAMAARGLRVLAVAVGKGSEEAQLQLLGFVGIADPPRPEAIEAVRVARGAGIATVMITGDHPATARAIARELGISSENDGQAEVVHARATPNDKLEIVRRWKSRGAIVAMTGDGVNDAPALREAHVGIAMGKGGTEVTREASDIVLADDNFASIVAGVAEGRGVFLNIRKALVYLLAGNTGELLVMLIAAMVGLPLPLLPLHLLWINLMTDGFPALALVMDAADPDALQQPPRDPKQPILGRVEWRMILLEGCTQAGLSLGVFIWALQSRDVSEARNLAFSTLVFGEVLRAFGARSATRTFWELPIRSHARLLGVAVLTVALQLAIHHFSAARALFQLEALSLPDCMLTLALGLVPLVLKESLKLATRNEAATSA
ncbi:MAG TPA: cation-transporting P-type ATPase, partial [Polyangiaceae bacterium]|nr:cation-transporting P-type ATPase [Polyangiaceae bacterium]